MNRRRFIPGTEAVEGRTVMASSGINNLFGIQLNTNLNVPITYQQKSLRINHLPYYLEKISPGRFLPKPELRSHRWATPRIPRRPRQPHRDRCARRRKIFHRRHSVKTNQVMRSKAGKSPSSAAPAIRRSNS